MKRKIIRDWFLVGLLIGAVLLGSCSQPPATAVPSTETPEVAIPEGNLNAMVGPLWGLVKIAQGDAGSSKPLSGKLLTLQFASDGTVFGNAGCNNFSGSFETTGNTITIHNLAATLMACENPTGIMEQEQQYLDLLSQVASGKLIDLQLVFYDQSGRSLLEYYLALEDY